MPQLVNRLLPFLFLGFAIVALVFGMILFIYLFIFGAIVGIILYCINWIREKFFTPPKTEHQQKKSQGRIIDSDDFREL